MAHDPDNEPAVLPDCVVIKDPAGGVIVSLGGDAAALIDAAANVAGIEPKRFMQFLVEQGPRLIMDLMRDDLAKFQEQLKIARDPVAFQEAMEKALGGSA